VCARCSRHCPEHYSNLLSLSLSLLPFCLALLSCLSLARVSRRSLDRLVVRGGRFAPETNTRGALEEYVSARAVGRIAQETLAAAPPSLATSLRGVSEPLTAKHVFDHARQGDALARSLVDDTCDLLALSAINMVRIFDTKHVIFGGGLIAAGDILIDGIRARFKHHYWSLTSPDSVEVSLAHLGTRAGMIGAAYLAHPAYRGAGDAANKP
jgi:predicted NBD/HSP70 family sugar kinase